MPTALESRAALLVVTGQAVNTSLSLLGGVSGTPEKQRLALLDAVPEIISYYTDGSSTLAADFYDDERDRAAVRGLFTAEPVVVDRTVKIRSAIAWAAEPLFTPLNVTPAQRLAEVVQYEVARPYRDTITTNRQHDAQCVGWERITAGGCNFCLMLAGRGAVYSENSVRFAAHNHCHCTAAPVFKGGERGPEASPLQYMASKRKRSPAEKERLRDYLDTVYGGQ